MPWENDEPNFWTEPEPGRSVFSVGIPRVGPKKSRMHAQQAPRRIFKGLQQGVTVWMYLVSTTSEGLETKYQ